MQLLTLQVYERINDTLPAYDESAYRCAKVIPAWNDRKNAIRFIAKAFGLSNDHIDHLERYDYCSLYGHNKDYAQLRLTKMATSLYVEMVVLDEIEGIARKSGTDANGCSWIEFEVDYFAEQTDGECRICGATISSGWVCLDGGEEVCSDHVIFLEDLAR